MNKTIVELDVRNDIANGHDPFEKIMKTVSTFNKDDTLILHAPFQPVPLFGVLSAQGFTYETEKLAEKHFKVIFTKKA
ncbi:DUF2249 domain-containing protein [Bacillus sp. B15-48]|uniref:DUF2249 domain-containing protein n=1 Tax=Bacillus sp. B15-48 TaxID=1548601 RepID=UPI00193FB946|nr:DUF2249 domain-containing protein [Bacillus sp. B15-48]MBM4762072.1 DUF2249 domain-containing protein [Bacillus sp. B15-48]